MKPTIVLSRVVMYAPGFPEVTVQSCTFTADDPFNPEGAPIVSTQSVVLPTLNEKNDWGDEDVIAAAREQYPSADVSWVEKPAETKGEAE